MTSTFIGEKWKKVKLNPDFIYENSIKLEISNFGRLKSTTEQFGERIIKGSTSSGYRTAKIKLRKPRDPKSAKAIAQYRKQIAALTSESFVLKKLMKENIEKPTIYKRHERALKELTNQLNTVKNAYKKDFRVIELRRIVNYSPLLHRLVAEYFLPKPKANQVIVSHMDYIKTNNHVSNLQWMTFEENLEHNKKSPYQRPLRGRTFESRNEKAKYCKLNSTKVILIKRRINEGIPLRIIAKTFKVTETQILRIKRGINWGDIIVPNTTNPV